MNAIETKDKLESKSRVEIEADQYATETLIPSRDLNKWLEECDKLTTTIISDFAQNINISPGIVVGRLQYIEKMKYLAFNELKIKYDWSDNC